MADVLTPFDTSSVPAFLATAPGVWEIEGERFEISTSGETGKGLTAVDPSGNKVSAVMVVARGRKVSDPPAAG